MKILYCISLFFCLSFCINKPEKTVSDIIKIRRSHDFEISGEGRADNWNNTDWIILPQRKGAINSRSTRVKLLYSETGIYYLFSCKDSLLTSTMNVDNMPLWKEDVVEVFLAPDLQSWNHFEYELSPLNYELALFVSKKNETITRWVPFYMNEKERVRKATSVKGGEKRSFSEVSEWTAEFYIPFSQLGLFDNTPPRSGTHWRGNMYRVDYDNGQVADWTWQPVSGSYHNTGEYGILQFE